MRLRPAQDWARLSPILVLVLVLGAAIPALAQGDLPRGVLTVQPRPAPALSLRNLDGEPFDLAEARGRWVFVHFWASWCAPCRREMPALQRMAQSLGDAPLALVLVNTAETEDTVFSFLGGVAPALDSLMDADGLVTEAWQPRGLPASFLVDRTGDLRYQALGGRPWDEEPYLGFLRSLTAP